MKKIDNIASVDDAGCQLPVRAYCSHDIYEIEKELIFSSEPRFIGCEKMIPNIGDYVSLQGEGHGRILVRSESGVKLLSNVCRHRQAIMLRGKGSGQNVVCPLHRWTYENDGRLIGAPLFDERPCKNLESFPLQHWNGLLFEDAHRNIAQSLRLVPSNVMDKINMENYVFDRVEYVKCNYNWKTFVDFYLEDYHVASFHPGLSNFVDCSGLTWDFGDQYSVQTVGFKSDFGVEVPEDSDVYRTWKRAVIDYYGDCRPDCAAIWLYIFPNVMVEWYPMVLVVSTIFPDGPERTLNQIEFYHPEDIMLFDHKFITGARAAASSYLETAVEDDEIGWRMQLGRKALVVRGVNDVGPYQRPLEDGMEHFHRLYRDRLQSVTL